MIPERDWRSAAVVIADCGVKLSEMVRKAYPDKPEITEPLKEFEEKCAEMLAVAAIQKGQQ